MDRRTWLAAGLALLAAPAATAQPPARTARIGLLGGSTPTSPEASHIWAGFFQGLRELGYVEGQNFAVEGRFYGDRVERLPELAAELVRAEVDIIVVGASPAPEVLKRSTSRIPIVLTNHGDPVGSGLVASLAKPGGNVTGVSMMGPALRAKQLQLLKEVVPGLTGVVVLSTPAVASQALELRQVHAAARDLSLRVHVVEVRTPSELPDGLSRAGKQRGAALFVLGGSSMIFAQRATLVDLVAKQRMPALYAVRDFVEAGGLLAYGTSLRESFRRAARYVDRILKGARPGDLPIDQPTTFELALNLKTARALGLTVPPSILARADHVIE
jgi:putative ABC transport system substrate-binding protein